MNLTNLVGGLQAKIIGGLILTLVIGGAVFYVKHLYDTNKEQATKIEQQQGIIDNLNEVNATKEEARKLEEDAKLKFRGLWLNSRKELDNWLKTHAVAIGELVLVDPAKAQELLFNEYKWRIKCIEFVSGKKPNPEDLADPNFKKFCEALK